MPAMNTVWVDFNKYWGCAIKSWEPRKDCLIYNAVFSHTLPKHPILFHTNVSSNFHMFLGKSFRLQTNKQIKNTEQNKTQWACQVSLKLETQPCLHDTMPSSRTHSLLICAWWICQLMINHSTRAPRITTLEHWLRMCQCNNCICNLNRSSSYHTCCADPLPLHPLVAPARCKHWTFLLVYL